LIASDEEEQDVIPATPVDKQQPEDAKPGRKRRRVRRMVEKTFTDEQGFTVTKREMESASESDEEQPQSAAKPTVKLQPTEESKAKRAAVSKKTDKQASIKNFFKKK